MSPENSKSATGLGLSKGTSAAFFGSCTVFLYSSKLYKQDSTVCLSYKSENKCTCMKMGR